MNELEALELLKPQLIDTACEILKYNTVKATAAPDAPFGKGIAECLEYTLTKCAKLGMTTYNCDNYAGHADFGRGEEIFGILGHLDVVPADEPDWKYPPFDAVIDNGFIYGRGALDDKLPMVACMYAVKALSDAKFNFTRKVRLIFGCDEESGMECMTHYFKKVAPPTMAISPDGDFPIINREKGILAFEVNCGKVNPAILDVYAGTRRNVVPNKCVAKIAKNASITTEYELTDNGDCYTLTTYGVASHGAMPDKGENAAWKMFRELHRLFPDDKAIAYASQNMCDYTGKSWGVDLHDDESGNLTANIGIVRIKNGELSIVVDVRHPVTFTNGSVIELFREVCSGDVKVECLSASEPLFVREDSYLIQTLLKCYHDTTGLDAHTVAIGGGTYSRCIDNCVAFGPEWEGEAQVIHQPNERIAIDRLMQITRIYMAAIKEICTK